MRYYLLVQCTRTQAKILSTVPTVPTVAPNVVLRVLQYELVLFRWTFLFIVDCSTCTSCMNCMNLNKEYYIAIEEYYVALVAMFSSRVIVQLIVLEYYLYKYTSTVYMCCILYSVSTIYSPIRTNTLCVIKCS